MKTLGKRYYQLLGDINLLLILSLNPAMALASLPNPTSNFFTQTSFQIENPVDFLHECQLCPHPPTPSPKFGRRGDRFKVPLLALGYCVHTSFWWGVGDCRSPHPPLIKGAIELKAPLNKGGKGGSGKDLRLLRKSVYTVATLGEGFRERAGIDEGLMNPSMLLQQGRSQYQSGQFIQAITSWKLAAHVYQSAGDTLNHALTLSYLTLAYQQVGQWSEAKAGIKEAIALLNNQMNPSQDRLRVLAQVLNTQGGLQFAQGQTESALTTWQEAAAIYAQVGSESQKVGILINQAQAQQALGLFLRARQTLDEVEKRLQQQPNSTLKAMGLRSLGNMLMMTGQAAAAQRILQQSLAVAEQISSPADQSAALLSLGNLARAQRDRAAAISFYQQATLINASPLISLQAQLNQFNLLIEQSQIGNAEALITPIQAQLDRLPANRSTIQARINFAASLSKLHTQSNTFAAQVLATAVQQARSLGDRPSEAQALGHLGNLYEQSQQWAEAKNLTDQALLIAQAIDTPEITYQWQWQQGRILKATGDLTGAIAAYQAAFKTLQSVRADLVAAGADAEFSFREQVEPVYRELVDLLLQPTATDRQTNLNQARAVIESLRLAELDNFFRTACLEGQSVAIDAVVQQTDAAIIYPIILKNRLEVIVSLPGQPLQSYTTAIPQQQVEATLERLRQELEKPLTTSASKQLGQQVYSWLIRPVEAQLQERSLKTLVFVLDGSLRSVPMAALHDGQQYLVERYSVALTPGLRLLNPQPLQKQGLSTLAAGLTQERHGFSALPNVGLELQEIQSEVASRLLLNQEFTSTRLQAQIQASAFPIVHLATHGQFSSNADETFVLAWDKPIKVNELGALLRDRESLTDKVIELLVLSACETAAGDKRAALGLAGIAVQAGARSTLASLWSLDDESGAQLMGQFYRVLANTKVSKAEALRQAQLSLLKDPNFRHPRYWAPYVLVGNWL
jgi:CHAT domain-containing protein